MSISRHSRKGKIRRRWTCPVHGATTAYGSTADCGCNARRYAHDKKKLVQNPREKRRAEKRKKRLAQKGRDK